MKFVSCENELIEKFKIRSWTWNECVVFDEIEFISLKN